MAPKLEKRFTMRSCISKDNSHDLKSIRGGPSRLILPVTGGFIKGSGLEAGLSPGGADWALLDPSTNVAHLNVRTQARTSDGHSIFVRYKGVLKLDQAAGKVFGWAEDAKTTGFGDHHWFSGPVFETSDPALKWIEDAFWVGQGRVVVDEGGSAVEYENYQVMN